MESPFYVELLSSSLNSYELKKFRIQHDETQLTNYLCKIAKEAAQKIACKDLFIFAIDTPKLVNYYKTRLCFRELENIEDKNFFEYAEPDYDDGCKFMFFPLS